MSDGVRCFGCQREIRPGDLHIKVGFDEWAAHAGLQVFGLDGVKFTYCEDCTEKRPNGRWTLTALGAGDDDQH